MGGNHTKIAGGGISETSRNEYRMDANGTITNYGEKGVQQNGRQGVRNGSFETIPVDARCVVEFRPTKDWKGEFGFDWPRKADSQMAVDVNYNGIIGKYGNVYATESNAVFTPRNDLHIRHLKEYEFFNSYKGRYSVPNMSLCVGTTAILDAITEVAEIPDSMRYDYDTETFELVILKRLTKSVGKNFDKSAVSIKCLKAFPTNKNIRVFATKNGKEQRVGQMKLFPNSVLKNANVVFIPVRYNNVQGSIKGNEVDITRFALQQSYVQASLSVGPAIRAEGWWFNKFFTTRDSTGRVLMDDSRWASLHRYLDGKFFETAANASYRNHYRVYMLPDGTLNGVAEGIGNTKVVVVFQGRNDSTSPHELLHAMGVHHTFDNNGLYTYKYRNTDNIMDYTHQLGEQRFSTNRWQWNIIRSAI